MRRVREMLKLRLDVGLSLQEVAFRSGIARSTLRDGQPLRELRPAVAFAAGFE